MKKRLSYLLMFLIAISCSSCANSKKDNSNQNNSNLNNEAITYHNFAKSEDDSEVDKVEFVNTIYENASYKPFIKITITSDEPFEDTDSLNLSLSSLDNVTIFTKLSKDYVVTRCSTYIPEDELNFVFSIPFYSLIGLQSKFDDFLNRPYYSGGTFKRNQISYQIGDDRICYINISDNYHISDVVFEDLNGPDFKAVYSYYDYEDIELNDGNISEESFTGILYAYASKKFQVNSATSISNGNVSYKYLRESVYNSITDRYEDIYKEVSFTNNDFHGKQSFKNGRSFPSSPWAINPLGEYKKGTSLSKINYPEEVIGHYYKYEDFNEDLDKKDVDGFANYFYKGHCVPYYRLISTINTPICFYTYIVNENPLKFYLNIKNRDTNLLGTVFEFVDYDTSIENGQLKLYYSYKVDGITNMFTFYFNGDGLMTKSIYKTDDNKNDLTTNVTYE